MIHIFRDQHLSQQSGGRDALVDDLGRYRCLEQSLAAAADPFAADVTLDLEHTGSVIELFTDVLSDALEAAAAAALSVLGLMADFPAGELSGERHSSRL